jgi:hypothetical protein
MTSPGSENAIIDQITFLYRQHLLQRKYTFTHTHTHTQYAYNFMMWLTLAHPSKLSAAKSAFTMISDLSMAH